MCFYFEIVVGFSYNNNNINESFKFRIVKKHDNGLF